MLFNSYIFWVFFAVVYLLYRLLNFRWQNYMLLVASYVFYGSWSWKFLILLLGTTIVDYSVGRGIHASNTPLRKKLCLCVSLAANLGLLGFFKYFNFFSHEMLALLTHLGVSASLPVLRVILPVGISFYTFQEIAYTVDVYHGKIEPVRFFPDFALYVAFFPQLVAGPIERPGRLIPQITHPRTLESSDFSRGLYLVLTGLFQKVVIADNMASIANAVFSKNPMTLTGPECLVGIYAFALQIYGDFAGYSAIARGVARWMGFELMANFRMPYFATSPSDFWRRWHISLSTWLRDYVYIPLGGNRHGEWLTYRNLMLTMFIGGLWHGAAWTFIIWGVFHGLILIAYRPFETRAKANAAILRAGATPSPLGNALRILITFHLVCFGWLLFRANSMAQVWIMSHQILTNFQMTHFTQYALGMMIFLAAPFLLYECWVERREDIMALTRIHWLPRGLAYAYLIWMLQVFPAEMAHEFIYFQF